jgi:hypothetical protein
MFFSGQPFPRTAASDSAIVAVVAPDGDADDGRDDQQQDQTVRDDDSGFDDPGSVGSACRTATVTDASRLSSIAG